jgi:hypothetical protein
MPTTTDPSDNSGERHQRSRLEVEIEEILERAERDNPLPPPIPFERPRRNPAQEALRSPQLRNIGTSTRQWLVAAPLIAAYMFAIIALIFSDVSPFLTRVAVSMAVIAVFWPIIEHYRNRESSTASSKMWRGRDMSVSHQNETSPWEQFRQWLRDRRILP